jgi:uncharacterized protein YggE
MPSAWKTWVVVVLAGVGGGLVASFHGWPTFAARSASTPASGGTLAVTGSATLSASPTGAQVTVGYLNNGTTAEATLARNNAVMSQILRRLEALHIPPKDLQTTGFSINPNYGNGSSPSITGYQVSNAVTVTVPGVKLVGPIIDAATAAGANQVNGVTFTIPQTVETALYAAAVQNATAIANAVAHALHARIAGVVQATVENAGNPLPVMAAALYARASSVPIMGGQESVSETVRVVYKLAP